MRISLSEEDRERFGCPEWLVLPDGFTLSALDAEALEVAGADWTLYGSQKVGGVRALVWLGLRRAGIDVPYADLDFNISRIRYEAPGKAPSATSGSRTPGPSAARTRASRRKA